MDAQRQAGAIERREPGALLLHAVEARQLHQRDDVAAAAGDGRLAIALQRVGAFLARLARRNPDLDELPVSEQAQRLGGTEQAAPVVVRTGDRVHLALAAAGRARRGTDGVARFLDEQRFVAPDGVDRNEPALEMLGQCVALDLHQSTCTDASRRSTCETMSLCMAR